jgi:Domain of unknown function (DUF3850)
MSTHELKTDPEVFEEVFLGHKSFEIRKNDRDFQVGDMLILRETQFTGEQMRNDGRALIYTKRDLATRVTYILRGPIYGLAEGWVIMAIA